MKTRYIIPLLPVVASALLITGCRKMVEVATPEDRLVSAGVYTDNTSAAAVVSGIYSSMTTNVTTAFNGGITANYGRASDEMRSTVTSPTTTFYVDGFSNDAAAGITYFWNPLYNNIYTCNSVLQGLSNNDNISAGVNQQLTGEVKFIRAFCYFYLVNLFGDVPLVLTTDFNTNAVRTRTPKQQVYDQMITDLKDAQNLLSTDYKAADVVTTTTERVRPTKWAATALLARVYLYRSSDLGTGEWSDAEAQATTVIGNTAQFGPQPLASAFLKNTSEAIWQLWPLNGGATGFNTYDANIFVLVPTSVLGASELTNGILPSAQLLAAFEPGDNRMTTWISMMAVAGSPTLQPYFSKYKIRSLSGSAVAATSEYVTPLRISELFLIRAEARFQQNKIADGVADLNVLRTRARAAATVAIPNPLPALSPTLSQADALTAVAHERQVELFAEYGHRWFDLKRTHQLDAVMSVVTPSKGGLWASYKALMPIPLNDLMKDPNLTPNPGY